MQVNESELWAAEERWIIDYDFTHIKITAEFKEPEVNKKFENRKFKHEAERVL